MTVYTTNNDLIASEIGQLLKTNVECQKLMWKDGIPEDVLDALETITEYVSIRIKSLCNYFSILTPSEESEIINVIKNNPVLYNSFGLGIASSSDYKEFVKLYTEKETALCEAFKNNKYVILF